MANLFVRNREFTTDPVEEMDTEDVDNIFAQGITSISWHNVVKTADMPFCFAPTINVEIVVAFGSRSIPPSLELLAIDLDIALSACLLGTLNLECDDL